MAATAAARSGRSTILLERYGFLGGAGTAGGLSTFCGLHARVHGEHQRVIHGLADELLDRLVKLDGLTQPHLTINDGIAAQAFDISAYKIAADELVAGSGAGILFHALAVGVVMADEDRIDAVLIESKSGRAAVRGRLFIDASGDGDVAAWAGVPLREVPAAGRAAVPVADVPDQRRRREGGRRRAVADGRAADGRRPSEPVPTASRARSRSSARSATRWSGGPTSPS